MENPTSLPQDSLPGPDHSLTSGIINGLQEALLIANQKTLRKVIVVLSLHFQPPYSKTSTHEIKVS